MKTQDIFRAIGDLPADMIGRDALPQKGLRGIWVRLGGLNRAAVIAASVAAIVGLNVFVLGSIWRESGIPHEPPVAADSSKTDETTTLSALATNPVTTTAPQIATVQTPESDAAETTSEAPQTTTSKQMSAASQTTTSKHTTTAKPTTFSTASTAAATTTTTPAVISLPYRNAEISQYLWSIDTPFYSLFRTEGKTPAWDCCMYEQILWDDMIEMQSPLIQYDPYTDDEQAENEQYEYYDRTFWMQDGGGLCGGCGSDTHVLNLIYYLPDDGYLLGASALEIDAAGVLHATVLRYDSGQHTGKPACVPVSVIYRGDDLPEIKGVETTWGETFADDSSQYSMRAESPVYQAFRQAVIPEWAPYAKIRIYE